MADTFNPILQEASVPTEETGLFGSKKARKDDPVFAPTPSTAIVVHRGSGGSSGDDVFQLLEPKSGMSLARLDPTSRFYRIDLGDKALVWDLAAPSSDAELGFTVKLVTVMSVTDPTTVAERGVRDARGHLRAPLTDVVRQLAGGFEIESGPDAAAAIGRELSGQAFDCGITISRVHAIVEPDAWSAERVESRQEQELEHQLVLSKNTREQERDRLVAERERASLEHQRLLEEQRDAFKSERERAAHDHELERQRLDEQRQKDLDELKAEREQAKLEHQGVIESKREELKAEHAQAERALQQQRQDFEEQAEARRRAQESEREKHEAEHEAVLAKIRDETENSKRVAADGHKRQQRERELADAVQLNDEISRHPGRMMGYLLALDETTAVREAIKVAQERQKMAWDRFKDLQKLDVFSQDELKSMATSLMNDPAGGAFGLEHEGERVVASPE